MRWFKADLHIHSVLSPCGGLEMSPLALMKRLKECSVEWLAITDHNSMANCPAYEKVAKREGLFFSWGVEIQSAEEIHVLAYFDDSAAAQAFDAELHSSLFPLENDADFFGDQVIIDENENILRVEQTALINSSSWDLSMVVDRVQAFGGLAVPAHVDASVNSILSQLGFMPEEPEFALFGITARLDVCAWLSEQPYFAAKSLLRASDAHYLADIGSGYSELYLKSACVAELQKAATLTAGRFIKR
ncbi:MAG: PHP domain-containing protein [Candidatus Cloacimonas sp.]|jgi:PHP family Zn ribbon phosphoesterase|nr:PHP domain-containing protein [Candidatus Cloacimonas sp.]